MSKIRHYRVEVTDKIDLSFINDGSAAGGGA